MDRESISVMMVSQLMLPFVAGSELKALRLSRGLIQRGVRVDLVTTRFRSGLPPDEVVDSVPTQRLAVLHDGGASSTGGGRHPRRLVRASQFLRLAVHTAQNARRYDIVHAHCISASALGAAAGAKVAGRRVIIEPSLAGHDGEVERLLSGVDAALGRRLIRMVDVFASKAPEITSELIAAGVNPDRIVPVKNSVDLTRFRPATSEERLRIRAEIGLPAGPLALFVGQLLERKGVPQLLDAWPEVRQAVPTASLALIGEGAEGTAVSRAAVDGLNGVRHLQVRSEIWDVIRCADVLVLPSRNESFANVVVEALACAVPVITGLTGIARRIEVDRAGRMLESITPEKIAAGLIDVLGRPDRGRQLGARGPEIARSFAIEEVVREYESLYQTLIAGEMRPVEA